MRVCAECVGSPTFPWCVKAAGSSVEGALRADPERKHTQTWRCRGRSRRSLLSARRSLCCCSSASPGPALRPCIFERGLREGSSRWRRTRIRRAEMEPRRLWPPGLPPRAARTPALTRRVEADGARGTRPCQRCTAR